MRTSFLTVSRSDMEFTGVITSLKKMLDGSALISVRVHAWQATDAFMEQLEKLQRFNLVLKVGRFRDKRSLNANALLWKCCTSLADILHVSKDEVYLKALMDYGENIYIAAVPEAERSLRATFKEVIPLGMHNINGQRFMNFRCVLGSSQYNTEQMSRLLDGVIEDCKEMGGFVPDERTIMTGLELWKKENASCADETETEIR